MSDASTGQLLDVAGVLAFVVRWLVLVSSTILVLFVAWLVLNFLWARGDKAISIRPFIVVDPSGNLKNAESGFAQILSAQMAELQVRILRARALLKQAASGQSLTSQADALSVPAGAQDRPNLPPWPELHVSTREKIELKVEGVDVSGVIAWMKAQLIPERSGLTFTAHIANDGEVTIAGDISDMKIDGVSTLYLSPSKRSPIVALDELAWQLFQLRLAGDDPRLGGLPLIEFRTLVDRLFEAADRHIDAKPETERREHYKNLSGYFSSVLAKHDDWLAMMILAGETARLSGDYDSAVKYFRLALDQETRLAPSEQDESRKKLIGTSLAAVVDAAAAQLQVKDSLTATHDLIRRRVLDDAQDAPGVEKMRQGFQSLYDIKGEGGYIAIAGLSGIPGWYSQNSISTTKHRLFLPWHRAYLLKFEQAARSNVKDFELPCWDWTKGGIPKSFSQKTLPDGRKNPLAAAYIDLPQAKPPIRRFTTREPAPSDALPSLQDVANVLSRKTWVDFSKALEELSITVHAWTGGDMGIVAFSSYDPLYYAHQCNVDRLWAEWQKANGPLEGPSAIDANLLDVVLDPFGIKVRDVLDTRKIGYDYQ
jgi:tyrosinase